MGRVQEGARDRLNGPPWYVQSFDEHYLTRYAHRDEEEARRDIRAILTLLPLQEEEPVLDLACGAGRHLLALHQEGFTSLVGLDLSAALLAEARTRLDGADPSVQLVRADMRRIPFRSRFACILSLFTSFGYFAGEEENAAVLRSAVQALRPGGHLLLDTLNRPAVVSSLVPYEEQAVDGHVIRSHRSFDRDRCRVIKRAEIRFPDGGQRTVHESVRVYDGEELATLLRAAGFVRIRCHGSLAGDAYGPRAPRLVVTARRPAADRCDETPVGSR
jgi:SAM-dependent methyltransferase